MEMNNVSVYYIFKGFVYMISKINHKTMPKSYKDIYIFVCTCVCGGVCNVFFKQALLRHTAKYVDIFTCHRNEVKIWKLQCSLP